MACSASSLGSASFLGLKLCIGSHSGWGRGCAATKPKSNKIKFYNFLLSINKEAGFKNFFPWTTLRGMVINYAYTRSVDTEKEKYLEKERFGSQELDF